MFTDEATYDPNGQCLEGTRARLLRELGNWSLDEDNTASEYHDKEDDHEELFNGLQSKRIVWVHGPAGSGKSTIANSVAAFSKRQGRCLASFCCKRDKKEEWCTVSKVLLMLAYQIAEANVDYANAVRDVLRGPAKDDVLKGNINMQRKELFENILNQTSE